MNKDSQQKPADQQAKQNVNTTAPAPAPATAAAAATTSQTNLPAASGAPATTTKPNNADSQQVPNNITKTDPKPEPTQEKEQQQPKPAEHQKEVEAIPQQAKPMKEQSQNQSQQSQPQTSQQEQEKASSTTNEKKQEGSAAPSSQPKQRAPGSMSGNIIPSNRKVIDVSLYQSMTQSKLSNYKSQQASQQQQSKQKHSENGSGSVFETKQLNKEMAVKTSILTNRINKLIQEENMLKKKAMDVMERANQIYEIKRRVQIKKQEARRKKIEVEEVPFTNPIGQLDMIKCNISKKYISNKNKEEALLFKKQMNQAFMDKARDDAIAMENLRFKVQQGQSMKQRSKQTQVGFVERRIEEVKLEQQSVLESQSKSIGQKERIMRELEQLEMNQINKLNHTKQQNKLALDQLEFSKNNQPKDYESKFQQSINHPKETKKINGLPASKFQNNGGLIFLEEDKKGITSIKTTKA